MSTESFSLPSSNARAVRVDCLALSLGVRVLQGFAAASALVAVLSASRQSEPSAWFWLPLSMAALVCGMGVGAATDRWSHLKLNLKAALVLAVSLTTAGLLLLRMPNGLSLLLTSILLVGLGAGSEWSSGSSMARQSLSNRVRWRGIRWWTAAYPAGILLCVSLAGFSDLRPAATIAGIGLIAGLAVVRPRLPIPSVEAPAAAATTTTPVGVTGLAGDPSADVDTAAVSVAESAAESAADCDATECCGGSAPAVIPTSFWQGVAIAVVGSGTLFGPVFCLLAKITAEGQTVSAVSLAVGLLGGYLLMFSAAPQAGYAVTLLPFFVLSVPAVLAGAMVSVESVWFPVISFFCGLFPGGVVCGCGAVIGELFSDCPTDSQRTRVLCVSLFVTSVFLLVVGSLQFLTGSSVAVIMVQCLLFLIGVLVIRTVRSPVIASPGTDGAVEEQDGELQDVIAALNG